MSIVTRLEAPLSLPPDTGVLTYNYPTGNPPSTLTLGGTYAHKWLLFKAMNDLWTAAGHPLTISQTATGAIVIESSALNFDLAFSETYGQKSLRAFLGYSAASYSNQARINATCPTTLLLDAAPVDEQYSLDVSRASNFADDGRVAAVLLGRYVTYRASLDIDNDEHTAFRSFWPWVASSRKLCIWRRWDTTSADSATYIMAPLLGDSGFKFLSLTDSSPDDLDAPRDAPMVTGHTHDIEGVVYGI